MFKTFQYFLAASIILTSCYGFRQSLLIHTSVTQTEDSLRIRSKVADLVSFAPGIILHQKSDCLIGHWLFYPNKNFLGGRSPINVRLEETCWNTPLPYTGSVRYLGPKDANTDSISFYSQTSYIGDEVVVESSNDYVPFIPASIFSTGMSQWTLYSEPYFRGTAVCYSPSYFFHYNSPMNGTVVQSVVKGCPSHVKNYIYPLDNPTD